MTRIKDSRGRVILLKRDTAEELNGSLNIPRFIVKRQSVRGRRAQLYVNREDCLCGGQVKSKLHGRRQWIVVRVVRDHGGLIIGCHRFRPKEANIIEKWARRKP